MLQIYYGDGKGKTTAAVGAAVRATGSGMKVCFVQFFKNGDSSECEMLKQNEKCDFRVSGNAYMLFEKMTDERKASLKNSYDSILEQLSENASKYQMIVLDESLDAHSHGFVTEQKLIDFVKNNSAEIEIIMTGRKPEKEILDLADYATEMKMIKHPFTKGTGARIGIEY